MHLTPDQREPLEHGSFPILHYISNPSEVDCISAQLPTLYAGDHPSNIAEQSSGAVRTTMELHLRDPIMAKLVSHPRLLSPGLQSLGESAYVQQVKVDVKVAFSAEIWQWRFDFATHYAEDGMP